jgi:SAM-dependent methyltransferase
MGHWDKLYTAGHTREPSPFAVTVGAALPQGAGILDLGCGNGRDSAYFAALGFATVGMDVSVLGIESAGAERDASGTPPEQCSFMLGDVTDKTEIARGLAKLPASGPHIIYGRFLLHSVPPNGARNLVMAVGELLRDSDCCYLEFRTDEDADLPKTFDHPRYYLPLALFQEMAIDAALQVELMAHGRGLATYKDEDPVVVQIRATADAPVVSATAPTSELLAAPRR